MVDSPAKEKTMNTDQTLALLRAVAATPLRPFTRNDWYAFADAGPDAQIGEMDPEALLAISDSVVVEQGEAPLVVVSGDTVEVYWSSMAGTEQHCLAIRLERI